jgi:hypothetical protein
MHYGRVPAAVLVPLAAAEQANRFEQQVSNADSAVLELI